MFAFKYCVSCDDCADVGSMPSGQQQAGAQQPHAQLGNPDLQNNLLDQLQGIQHYLQIQATPPPFPPQHCPSHYREVLSACLLKVQPHLANDFFQLRCSTQDSATEVLQLRSYDQDLPLVFGKLENLRLRLCSRYMLLPADLPADNSFLENEQYLLSENSLHFMEPTATPPQEAHNARPPPSPSNPPSPLHNYLASDSRQAFKCGTLAGLSSSIAAAPMMHFHIPHLQSLWCSSAKFICAAQDLNCGYALAICILDAY